jgi:N-acetyl sugar amidotransferase
MDNISDPTIVFAQDGTCNYCTDAIIALKNGYFPNEEGKQRLDSLFSKIKLEGKGKKYDCMMGLSGGLDSSYAAFLAFRYGLRVLMVHIDDGLDAKVTTENIKRICTAFRFDLITEKPDKERFTDMTRAFILAGLPDIAIPQDNVLLACLYKYAQKNKIKYLLSGENFSLECITQSGKDASDKVHILDVYKKYGQMKYDGILPLFSLFEKHFRYKYLNRIQFVKPLQYVDYNSERALKELNEACGYEYYGNKHWESRFTKFLQTCYLPQKFKIDKRKSHFSSMIISGQMTRDEALAKISEPPLDKQEMETETDFILGMLGITRAEYDNIMKEPPHSHSEFRSSYINKMASVLLDARKKIKGY